MEQKVSGWVYKNDHVLYLMKKHICPDCQSRLKTVKVTSVVDASSPPVADMEDLVGKVNYTRKELECPACGFHATAEQMRHLEGLPNTDHEKAKRMGFWIFLMSAIGFLVFFALRGLLA